MVFSDEVNTLMQNQLLDLGMTTFELKITTASTEDFLSNTTFPVQALDDQCSFNLTFHV